MPVCPKCRREYQDWAKVCYYCEIDLVEKLPDVHKAPSAGVSSEFSDDVPPDHLVDASTEPFVTLASYSYPQLAYLWRAKLQSECINCYIADDYIVTANWLYSNAVGGVKLRVRELDLEDALAVLNEVVQTDTETVPDTIGFDDEKCPRCNSENIRQAIYDIRFLNVPWVLLQLGQILFCLTWIFIFIPLPFIYKKWQCRNCGNKWGKKQSSSGNAQ
jgi:hypothetical protein